VFLLLLLQGRLISGIGAAANDEAQHDTVFRLKPAKSHNAMAQALLLSKLLQHQGVGEGSAMLASC
jgi:hypothetical protein